MKKKIHMISILCAVCIFASLLSGNVIAASTETENGLDAEAALHWKTIGGEYPHTTFFIYDDSEYVAELTDGKTLLSESGYVNGYLYAADKEALTVQLMYSRNINKFEQVHTKLYCIADEDTISIFDIETKTESILYSAEGSELKNLIVTDEGIYFIRDDSICILDEETRVCTVITTIEGIDWIYPVSTKRIGWTKDEYPDYRVYDIRTGQSTQIDLRGLDAIEDRLCKAEEAALKPWERSNNKNTVSLPASAATSEGLPLDNYPAGSYFTKNGLACTDHGADGCNYYDNTCNCKNFANSIQCDGFAKYVFARCVNLSTWKPSGHEIRTNVTPIKDELQHLKAGTYLRLQVKDRGFQHSIIIMSTSETGIAIYEANYPDNNCVVNTRTQTYAQLANKYSEVISIYAHDLSYQQYNASYHKVACTVSGCCGYRLRPHYAATTGANRTCLACGYVGTINVGIQSDSASK